MPLHRLTLDDPTGLALLVALVPMAWILLRSGPITRPSLRAFLIRGGLVVLLALAAAGLRLRLPSRGIALGVVIDRSASVPERDRALAISGLTALGQALGPEDALAVVVAADGARVEQVASDHLLSPLIETTLSPHRTDLASGVRLAAGLLPDHATRRLVVFSDGEETTGDVLTEVAALDPDLEVWTVPLLSREEGAEVLLDGIVAPDRVAEGEAFILRVVALSSAPADGTLRLSVGDRPLGALPLRLESGRQVITVPQEADAPGLLRFRATWEAAPGTDAVAQNNVAVATVAVSGRPRVLLVHGEGVDPSAVLAAMGRRRIEVDVVDADGLPGSLAALSAYAVVLLMDVPAYTMTTRQMEVLRAAVRDLGRGLAMLGGDESFGVGGWYKTPVEEVLPVRCDITDSRPFPSLALVEAIDKSGSMGGTSVQEKLGMAKEAAVQTMEIMAARDRFGVVAFDGAASWEVPMTTLARKKEVEDKIARIRPGGGTEVYPALIEAYGALGKEVAAQKHIVLLSDGVTIGADFETLIRMGRKRGSTLTTVAFGDDADRESMKAWAAWGQGRSYLVTRPEHIPRIFTREAMLASRAFLREEPFVPLRGAPDPVTDGLPAALPTLYGYVATEPKPRANVALWAHEKEHSPLLATWRHGLGRTAAWTSDVEVRWARNWVGTATMDRVLGQLVEWLAGDLSGDVQAAASLDGGQLRVQVDAVDVSGQFLDGAIGEARVLAPDLTVSVVPLRQAAPGRYEVTVPADQDGTWLAGVVLRGEDGAVFGQATAEASQPWSPEYRPGGDGSPILREMARLGRGEVLSIDRVRESLRPPLQARLVPVALANWLLAFALGWFLLDAAARRVAWGWWRRVAPSLGPTEFAPVLPSPPKRAPPLPVGQPPQDSGIQVELEPPAPAPETPRDPYVEGLLGARRRAREKERR